MSKEKRHLSLNLQGTLKWRKNLKGLFIKDDGRECSHQEAKQYIADCIAKGWVSVPMCTDEECPDFDYFGGGCPGHPVNEE